MDDARQNALRLQFYSWDLPQSLAFIICLQSVKISKDRFFVRKTCEFLDSFDGISFLICSVINIHFAFNTASNMSMSLRKTVLMLHSLDSEIKCPASLNN